MVVVGGGGGGGPGERRGGADCFNDLGTSRPFLHWWFPNLWQPLWLTTLLTVSRLILKHNFDWFFPAHHGINDECSKISHQSVKPDSSSATRCLGVKVGAPGFGGIFHMTKKKKKIHTHFMPDITLWALFRHFSYSGEARTVWKNSHLLLFQWFHLQEDIELDRWTRLCFRHIGFWEPEKIYFTVEVTPAGSREKVTS